MSTRGAFGFRINDQDKVTYNHSDSYPSGLGQTVIEACIKHPAEYMRIAVEKIELVDEDKKPTKAQIKKCQIAGFIDTGVGLQSEDDWYCLLRGAQGDVEAFIEGRVPFMIDGNDFLADSLFCEWAYIINLDTQKLEIYRGFNKDPDAAGRYAALGGAGNMGYRGVALLREIALSDLYGKSEDLTKKKYEKWVDDLVASLDPQDVEA